MLGVSHWYVHWKIDFWMVEYNTYYLKLVLLSCCIIITIIGQMPLASDPRRARVSHHRSQNSLNIDFTGIHALEHLFSIKIYEQRDQYEIFRTIFKFWVLIGPTLVTPLGCVASMSMIDDDCCVASASRRSLMQHNHDPSLSAVMHGLILLD